MQVCTFTIPQEIIMRFVSLFRLPPSCLLKLEQESSKLSIMGYASLTISVIRRAFVDKKCPQSGEVSEAVAHYCSTAHVLGYIKHKTGITDIAASKLTTIFHCFCQLSVETGTAALLDFSILDAIARELIHFDADAVSLGGVIADIEILGVRDYNAKCRGRPGQHLMTKMPYMTGAGNQREVVCCPQCGNDPTSQASCRSAVSIHKGEVELTRETKTAATRTKIIARWTCCGTPIATTDTSIIGYKLEVEALKNCTSSG